MISAAKYTVPSELPKSSGVLQYGKVKFTSFSTKGDLQSFQLFSRSDYSEVFVFHRVLLQTFLGNKTAETQRGVLD